MSAEKVTILEAADGFTLLVGQRRWAWNHNDPNPGEVIKVFLEDNGINVEYKEDY